MKKSLMLATLAAIITPLAAHAQNLSPGPVVAAGNSMMSLTAEGRSMRKPNLATFSAGVVSNGKSAGEALAANSADMNRVIAALKRAGIAERDIQTSNLSLNPIYQPQRQMPNGAIEPAQPTIIGYQVNNMVNVRQRNLDQYGKVIDTLVSAGANQVNGPSFELENSEAAMDEARTEAMKKARSRAELYARAAGMRIVRILTITESGGYSPQPMVMYARMQADAAPAPPPPPMAPGELSLSASVSVTYELAP